MWQLLIMFYFARRCLGHGYFPCCSLVTSEGLQYFILYLLLVIFWVFCFVGDFLFVCFWGVLFYFVLFCFFWEGSIFFPQAFSLFFFSLCKWVIFNCWHTSFHSNSSWLVHPDQIFVALVVLGKGSGINIYIVCLYCV